jgi:endonuclease/exonuclease/phosphatase family metal-dependent hydrolase
MNEVTRPNRPRGTTLSAVATVTALALLMIFASVAAGASEPMAGGTTSLTLKKGFAKKLGANDVKLQRSGSGKIAGNTVQLDVSGGAVDAAAGQGTIQHVGGFKLKRGKSKISITKLEVDLAARAVSAKVGGTGMKLGSLTGLSVSQQGSAVDVGAVSLKLTGKAAKAVNRKLNLDGTFKAGNSMSNVSSRAQVHPNVPAEPPVVTPPAGPPAPNTLVNVMTRNLYLGADLGPAIAAPNPEALFAAAGQILAEVEHNDFPTRAEGLADEILNAQPDLVGMQEVALWRTGPPNPEVLTKGPSATTVKYDYLQELLAELNAGGQEYEVVVVQPEFDFEVPADTEGTAAPDINGRLTMRDVILKRSAGVETWNADGANFDTPLPIPILGKPLPVKRGWTSTDASVRGSRPFHFVNTHLEAFQVNYRLAQAAELVDPPDGPVLNGLPTVLLGDLNSDDDTTPNPGDSWAYEYLTHHGGLVERSTDEPLSCCLDASELGEFDGGEESDFDHQVDHIMTNDPLRVQLLSSSVSGLSPVNGFWNSDHAGVFSSLQILP